MAEFSYKPALPGNILNQYVENRHALSTIGLFNKSPEKLVAYQTSVIQNEIRNASAETQYMMGQICSSIDSGFQMLSTHLRKTNYKLGEINDTLNSMYAMLDWKTDIVINLQRETNSLLKDLLKISVVPDRQKDSYAYLEKAINFFNAGIEEGFESTLFEKVNSNLNAALQLDDDNFITHFYFGQLQLHSKEFLNPVDAEKNLTYSAKLVKILALSNSDSNQTVLFNQHQFGKKINNKEALYFEASSALIAASKAGYLQMKFEDASEYCKQAMILTPNWTEPLYRYAKAKAANGTGQEAADAMKKAIEMDRYQILKILQDEDLNSCKEIQELVNDLNKQAISEAETKYQLCIDATINWRDKSSEKDTLNQIAQLLVTKDFLSAKKALDIMNQVKERSYKVYGWSEVPSLHTYNKNITSTLYDFLCVEGKEEQRDLDKEKKEIEKRNQQRWESDMQSEMIAGALTGAGYGAAIGFVIGFFKGCNVSTFSEDKIVLFGYIVLFAFIGALLGALAKRLNLD